MAKIFDCLKPLILELHTLSLHYGGPGFVSISFDNNISNIIMEQMSKNSTSIEIPT